MNYELSDRHSGRTHMVERCTRALCIAVILLQAAYQLI